MDCWNTSGRRKQALTNLNNHKNVVGLSAFYETQQNLLNVGFRKKHSTQPAN